jgi:alpha-beta hydrolase superfamily lysophospholipase
MPDRRGSGRNQVDRGHVASYRRLIADVVEIVTSLKGEGTGPVAVAGISWGGKLAVVAAAENPRLIDAVALICPGLHAKVDPSLRDRLRIAWAFFTNKRKQFPIPLADPALFTDDVAKQAFIAADPLALRTATASLLAASRFLDRRVRGVKLLIRQPKLLMLAGRDRIVDNARTLAYFGATPEPRTLIEYPEGCHTLEFDPDPARYARDLADWLDATLVSRSRN